MKSRDAAMSAFGTKRTSPSALHMSAFGGKADMTVLQCKCPLLTQSGHRSSLNEPRVTTLFASLLAVS